MARYDLKNKSLRVKANTKHPQFDIANTDVSVEDYWDNLVGNGWAQSANMGNPAAIIYFARMLSNGLPPNDEVVYVKNRAGFGILLHTSEIENLESFAVSA